MTLIDEQVNGWMLEKFFDSSIYDPKVHGAPGDVSVITTDVGWICGCYSSWTRDDSFELTARLATRSGEVDFNYGYWADCPRFIEELYEYINGNDCYYESEEYLDGTD